MDKKPENGARPRRSTILEQRFMFHLRRLRHQAGLTQRELAEAVSMENASSISMLETGIRGASPETVESLAHYFGVDPSEFYLPPSKVSPKTSPKLA